MESEADDAPTDLDERCERDERREYDEESDRRASGPIPDDEREALETIAHGAVLTSGGVAGQRALTAATEFVARRLARRYRVALAERFG